MKTLLIMRHAKSSWDAAALSDFERPLNNRGLKAAPLMGEMIVKNNLDPELILSSPAKRAEQTAKLVKEAAGLQSEIRFEPRIYEAAVSTLLEIIIELNNRINSILLVGHNPGFEGLINVLTGEIHPMPTAALAVVNLKIDNWNDLKSSTGKLRMLIKPKELE